MYLNARFAVFQEATSPPRCMVAATYLDHRNIIALAADLCRPPEDVFTCRLAFSPQISNGTPVLNSSGHSNPALGTIMLQQQKLPFLSWSHIIAGNTVDGSRDNDHRRCLRISALMHDVLQSGRYLPLVAATLVIKQ